MRWVLLDMLVCPRCRCELVCEVREEAAGGDEIVAGVLRCLDCDVSYPIENGIPRFVSGDNYAASFGLQWNLFRGEQLDSVTGHTQSADRLHRETDWSTDWLRGKWILDAGSGAGRFLDIASRSDCQVVGVDITNAVDAARESLGDRSNVHLVQASIYELPFRPAVFDGVYCIGVVQHTPDPVRAVSALPSLLKPGGRLAVTMYERGWLTRLNGKYLVRPLTTRLNERQLFRLVKILMPVAFAATEVLYRLPVIGKVFRFVIPIANYVHDSQLTLRERYRWAVMDTFDMLAPKYDYPQREATIVAVLRCRGIRDLRRLPNPGLNLVGVRAQLMAETLEPETTEDSLTP